MLSSIFYTAVVITSAAAHGVILAAQGQAGSPASIGFQVDTALPRNCTTISPCQQDTTIIRDAEISANIVNECGRTELSGNIDVGQNTENQLAAGTVTTVKTGTIMTVTIHQINADGAGPYACDLDETSNAGTTFRNLSVTNNVPGVNGLSQAQSTDFNISVALPTDLACTGGSTGNICTVRCRNNAVAGPFGGCFAVQQSDIAPTSNSAETITTAATLDDILAQAAENQVDLKVAIAANQQAGSGDAVQALAVVNALLGITITSKASPVETIAADLGSGAAATTSPADTVAASTTAAASTATAAASTSAATTSAISTKKSKGKKNGRRDLSLRWAKRSLAE